jgi:hypothetical protein
LSKLSGIAQKASAAMIERSGSDAPVRQGLGRWFLLLALACWLAAVPLGVTAVLATILNHPPTLLVQLGVVPSADPALPSWAFGLLATGLSLGGHLLVFVPFYVGVRRSSSAFLQSVALLMIAIALFQALNALTAVLEPETIFGPGTREQTLTAALRLLLVVPLLVWGLGAIDARRQGCSVVDAWRRIGLRVWVNPSAAWTALGCAGVAIWPWVIVGSLGSPGTTMANILQALPNAVGDEMLFRGFALAWLSRTAVGSAGSTGNLAEPTPPSGKRQFGAVVGSLLLFVAAQGGSVLPFGDWVALLRFLSALLLGLLVTELTIRAGGAIWPALVVHFLFDWFHLAFVDPRSQEEVLHWVAQAWAPVAAGGMGLLLLLGRKVARALRGDTSPKQSLLGLRGSRGAAAAVWIGIAALYISAGVPGFHPDGFLIFLEEQADLVRAASISDPAERRAWVYGTLVETAQRSQAPLQAELDRRGVSYRSHYLINMIEVLERPGLRRAFLKDPEVASVLFQPGVRRYAYSFQLPPMDPGGPRGVEWNIRELGVDRVWELGYMGQGVIVGSADTGVVWDHPALKKAYLGWDGQAVDHSFRWYDPWDGRAAPWDDSGHGTHTTGTMVGLDGENRIGVAPGARWIACRNMRHGLGNPGSYLSCMEFLLAPFPRGGDPLADGDPGQGAHVVNNSWGCPGLEGCLPDTLQIAVDSLRVAGQMMVVGTGNEGPACGSIADPVAIYDAVLSVGAIGRDGRAVGFSSRGPVTVGGSQRLKPDLVAPGLDIRSAVPGGYASLLGTSMASPHVAGGIAVLWSVEPALIGDLDRTEKLLLQTAQPLTVEGVCTDASGVGAQGEICGCGSDRLGSVPNNVYGWGRVDTWAAAQHLLGGE